jgi:hypothetical protein
LRSAVPVAFLGGNQDSQGARLIVVATQLVDAVDLGLDLIVPLSIDLSGLQIRLDGLTEVGNVAFAVGKRRASPGGANECDKQGKSFRLHGLFSLFSNRVDFRIAFAAAKARPSTSVNRVRNRPFQVKPELVKPLLPGYGEFSYKAGGLALTSG